MLRRYKAFPGRAVAPPMRPTDSPYTATPKKNPGGGRVMSYGSLQQ